MSYLVENPEDRFSHDEAQISKIRTLTKSVSSLAYQIVVDVKQSYPVMTKIFCLQS